MGEADGVNGTEAEGVAAGAGGVFDGEAALEVLQGSRYQVRGTRFKVRGVETVGCGELFPGFWWDGFCGGHSVGEPGALLLCELSVDLVGLAVGVEGVTVVHLSLFGD